MLQQWQSAAERLRRLREWVLLDGNRLLVAAALLATVFATVSLPGVADALGGWSSSPTNALLGSFIAGNLTLVTVVLSINQLVLSRELRTPNEIVPDMAAAIDYRNDVADATGVRVTPEDLTHFLHTLLQSMADAVDGLEATTESVADTEARRNAAGLATSLREKVDEMDELLVESDVDLFTALSTILRYDFAAEFNRAWWLATREPAYGEDAVDALEAVQEHVRYLEVARQYVKTLYVQYELATFSRLLLYLGFVSILVSVVGIAAERPPVGTPEGIALRASIVVGFAPLSVLLAYVLRVATVAQRTAAFVPFGPPE